MACFFQAQLWTTFELQTRYALASLLSLSYLYSRGRRQWRRAGLVISCAPIRVSSCSLSNRVYNGYFVHYNAQVANSGTRQFLIKNSGQTVTCTPLWYILLSICNWILCVLISLGAAVVPKSSEEERVPRPTD